MAFVPLDLPPGLYRNGTRFQAQGRYYDGGLVRWQRGRTSPIGGWQARTTVPLSGIPRALLAWRDNGGARRLAVGTNTNLYALTQTATTATDITPTGLTTGRASSSTGAGYGVGAYGVGLYGTPRPDASAVLDADVWTLDTFGEVLVGCLTSDGRIFSWPLTGIAAPVTNAPTGNAACMVTAEGFLFALGASGLPRRVKWGDQRSLTTWTPAATNQAGDFDLQTPGRIMCGTRLRFGSIIWTDLDIHLGSYVGLPYVYTFQRVGDKCGIIARKAFASADTAVYWMSPAGFFAFDGSVRQLNCEVFNAVYSDINIEQKAKIHAFMNSQFTEVWWFYPSSASTEIDRYVSYNILEDHWSQGSVNRTAAADRGIFFNPIMCGSDGILYDHEIGASWGGATPFLETGPMDMGNGDNLFKARSFIPDEIATGNVRAFIYTSDWPEQAETLNGPYTIAAATPIEVRLAARQMRMRFEFLSGEPASIGSFRADVVNGGRF